MFAWATPSDRALDANGLKSVSDNRFDSNWLETPIPELLGGVSKINPDRVAVDDGALRLTYAQVWMIVCRLGKIIAQSVTEPGPIAVLLPNAATYWPAVLGCLAAGRACVQLDRDDPAERNAEIIAAARPAALISDAEGVHRYSAWSSGLPIILVENALFGPAPRQPSAVLGPGEPAFILYTSGSTGRPKGIVQSQRNVLYRLMYLVEAAHLGKGDRALVLGGGAANAFSATCVLPALLTGAAFFPVDMRRVSLASLAATIRDRQITILQGTPSLLRMLSRLNGAPEMLRTVRLVRIAGEPLLQADLQNLRRCLPRECQVLHVLGSTEATLAQWIIPPGDTHDPVRAAVGYPPPCCQTAVLDENGRCCRPGESGELVLRSRYIALGEWQDGRLVPGRMRPDPEDPAFRIYHTGDLVWQADDGVLVHLGRKDRQLKIRGQRVEPIEIEGVLRRSPHVLEAAVLPRQDGEDIRLVAFVVPAAKSEPAMIDSLRALFATSLPAHMRPSRIIMIDAMPLLPSGKIDGQALLARDQSLDTPVSQALSHSTILPSASSVSMVAHAWRKTLDRTSLERNQRFDDAGGDSLRLLQFLFSLEEQCGAMLPLDAFSGTFTPSDFASTLDHVLSARTDPPSAMPLVFLLPGTAKRDPNLDRLRGACAGSLNIVPIDYGDWFERVGRGVDFAQLVHRVVAQIVAIAPSGTIVLAGYSLGGYVAHAAAQLLIAADRTVALVAIFATDGRLRPPHPDPVEFLTQPTSLGKIRELAAAGRRGEARNAIVRVVVRYLVRPRSVLALRLLACVRPGRWFGDFGFFLDWLLNQVLLHRTVRDWREGGARAEAPMPAPAVLFRPRDADTEAPADLGWQERCSNLTVHEVGGDHSTMLDRQHVRSLAQRFSALVHAAVASKSPTPASEFHPAEEIVTSRYIGATSLTEAALKENPLPELNGHLAPAASAWRNVAPTHSLLAPARFISCAWGEEHLQRLLTLALPALLAPNNLPRVAASVSCELFLLIEERQRTRVISHPTVQQVQRSCPVHLLSLDDLISTPDKYGMSLTYALHRGMAALPAATNDQFLFFINADFIAADGSFNEALSRLKQGRRLIAAPSYCVVDEVMGEQLKQRVDRQTGALVISKRAMAQLALQHLHRLVKAKTVNQSEFHARQMDQFYWRLNDDTLLGHQMPVAIVAMRPQRNLDEPICYWDYGLIKELCPDAEPHVVGDSDEFMMIELRNREAAEHQVLSGPLRIKEASQRMIGWMTAYQRDFAKYPLTLHSKDIPENAKQARAQLEAIVCETLSYAPADLPSHIGHPQWTYHLRDFTVSRHKHHHWRPGNETDRPVLASPVDRAWRDLQMITKEYEVERSRLERARADVTQDLPRRVLEEAGRESERIKNDFLADLMTKRTGRQASPPFYWSEPEDCSNRRAPSASNPCIPSLIQEYQQKAVLVQHDIACKMADLSAALKTVDRQYERQIAALEKKAASELAAAQRKYEMLLPKRVASAEIPRLRIIADDKMARRSRHPLKRARVIARLWTYRSALRPLEDIVASAQARGARSVLVISGGQSVLDSVIAGMGGLHGWLPSSSALCGNLHLAIHRDMKFDLCVWEASDDELCSFVRFFEDVKHCINAGGTVAGFCWTGRPAKLTPEDIVLPEAGDAHVRLAEVSAGMARLERVRRLSAAVGMPATIMVAVKHLVTRLPLGGNGQERGSPTRPAQFSAIAVEARCLA